MNRAIFDKLQQADLLTYYRQYYIPNNMSLVIVGDIEPAALLKNVKILFGSSNKERICLSRSLTR